MSIGDRYKQSFGPLTYGNTEDFVAQVESEFSVGARLDLLLESERPVFAEVVERVRAANRDEALPHASEVYLNDSAGELDLGEPKPDIEHALADEERELFAHYGILPAHHLRTLSPALLARIGMCIARICREEPVGTSVAFLFCKPLFELVTNPELVARVTSLLGDDVTCVGTSGPMYIPPGGQGTEWHFAGGADFGGGSDGVNLDLVTCWLALDDVPRERAPMKMLPRSFCGNLALHSRDASSSGRQYGVGLFEGVRGLDTYLADALAGLGQHAFRMSDEMVEPMVARRFNSRRIAELQFIHDGAKRYKPFHRRIDTLMCVGPEALRRGQPLDMIAMEAARGDVYTFTSMNTHGSLANTSDRWRRAISVRYVRTGAATANSADNHFSLLQTYARLFPETNDVYHGVGKRLEQFEHVCPRIAVSGDIPDSVAEHYWELDRLRQVLNERPMLGRRRGRTDVALSLPGE